LGFGYRKNKATFHAVPPARVRPPPATLRPLGPTPGVGPPAPRCPPGAGLARARPVGNRQATGPRRRARLGRRPGSQRGWGGAGGTAARERPFPPRAPTPPVAPAPPTEVSTSSSARSGGRLAQPALAARRRRLAWGCGGGRYVLTFDPQEAETGLHARGVRVILHGGRLASWYRISEQRYSQIGRTAPDGTLRINTIERYEAVTDGRLYATIISWRTSQPTARAWSDSQAMSTNSWNTSPPFSCRYGVRSGMSKAAAPEPASSPCRPIVC